eukprot:scaffold265015_cov33-Attheya_sp.AAC.2
MNANANANATGITHTVCLLFVGGSMFGIENEILKVHARRFVHAVRKIIDNENNVQHNNALLLPPGTNYFPGCLPLRKCIRAIPVSHAAAGR